MAIQQLLAAYGSRAVNTVSLLHFDGTNGSTSFPDDTGRVWTANGNAQVSTAEFQFGGASLLLDGTGDFLQTPATADIQPATTDFTVECWIRPSVVNAIKVIAATREDTSSAVGWWLAISATGQLWVAGWNAAAGATPIVEVLSSASTVVQNTWAHVAFSKQGTTWRLFYAGTLVGSATQSQVLTDPNRPLRIGRSNSTQSARDYSGYIDEFRVTKGLARYTANFTPPTAPFTLD